MFGSDRFAEILAVNSFGEKSTITYKLPENCEDILPGNIVEAPFRKGALRGVVLSTHERRPEFATKALAGVLADLALRPWQLELMKWISEYYFCSLNLVLPSFVPKHLLKVPKRLKKEEIFEEKSRQFALPETSSLKLSEVQQEVFDKIVNSGKKKFLLHGVTGAGKTEIYLQLAINLAAQGKQVLILVPEISLTPQIVNYFKKYFSQIEVINSKISAAAKSKSWKRIFANETKLVIASRSGIFAPFANLGAIVIDEEHDSSYKQDSSPRYDARKVAEKISDLTGSKLVFGSATPSVETYQRALDFEFELLELASRANSVALPQISLVDMRDEKKKGNFSIFSDVLVSAIGKKIKAREQVILFLNRRGSASSILCTDCGEICKCAKCEVPFVYHEKPFFQQSPALICHSCGLVKRVIGACVSCGGADLKYLGLGTQRVESELQKIFPHARILRADKDSTSKKDAFKEIYRKMRDHEADILIGTQMIAKGLHFSKANLVGVVLADLNLSQPDFRAGEKVFQLLTQVAGRAGRKSGAGEVLLQTYNPQNPIIQLAKNQDYLPFFSQEIQVRREMNLPPFRRLIKFTFEHESAKEAFVATSNLKKQFSDFSGIKVSQFPSMFAKKGGKYRWCVLLNCSDPNSVLDSLISQDPRIFDGAWQVDVDPASSV
jgi:primosomal protein N' (replication factor Y)